MTPSAPTYAGQVAIASIEPKAPATGTLPRAIRAIDVPEPRPLEWLIEDVWPAGELGLLVGDGGAFKSTVALHMAAAVAGGRPVFDKYAVRQRPTLVMSAEDSQDVVLMRLNAIIAGHGWPRTETLSNMHVLCDGDQTLGSPRWRMHISAEVERIQPGLIVFDPWAELQGGDENSNTDSRPAIKYLRSVARSVDAAVAVVHHAGKAGQDKRQLDRIRGASALPSAARVILFFDWRDDGVAVENLKLSRAPRLKPFMILRDITSARDNRAQWVSVRLTVEDAAVFTATRAENWILTRLRTAPEGRATSTELREFSSGSGGVRTADLQAGLDRLQAHGFIQFQPGLRGAKHWFLTSAGTAEESARGQIRDPVHPVPDPVPRASSDPVPPPLGGTVARDAHSDPEKTGTGSTSDFLAEVDERLGQLENDEQEDL